MTLAPIGRFRPLRHYALVVCVTLWCAACVLTHLPPDDVPNFHASDTTLHAAGFAGLTASFFAVLLCRGVPRLKRILMILAILPAYGALDEWTQPLFGRTCDLNDWMHDFMGMLLGIVIMELGTLLVLWFLFKVRPDKSA